jgi:hypothetical protein
VAVSPNRSLLAVGDAHRVSNWQRVVRIIDLESQTELRRLSIPGKRPDVLMSLAFSPDGKRVAWGGYGRVHVFDVATGKRIWKLKCYETNVVALAFCPDGTQLAANSGKEIRIWDLHPARKNAPGLRKIPHSGRVQSLAYSSDSSSLASSSEGSIYLWNATSGKQTHHIELPPIKSGNDALGTYVRSLAFSPHNKFLLVGGDSRLQLLRISATEDTPVARVVRQVNAKTVFFQVRYAPDGKTFAARDYRSVRIYQTDTGKLTSTFNSPAALEPRKELPADTYEEYLHSFAFTPDGKKLVMTYGGNGIGIWSARPPSLAPISVIAQQTNVDLEKRAEASTRKAKIAQSLDQLAAEIRPQSAEELWRTIPWCKTPEEAENQARQEARPILVWTTSGPPFEHC